MKFFIIEIEKPIGEFYTDKFRNKINSSEFNVVKVCATNKEAEHETVKLQIANVKNQSGLHYEVIRGEGTEGYKGLQNELIEFYKKTNGQ